MFKTPQEKFDQHKEWSAKALAEAPDFVSIVGFSRLDDPFGFYTGNPRESMDFFRNVAVGFRFLGVVDYVFSCSGSIDLGTNRVSILIIGYEGKEEIREVLEIISENGKFKGLGNKIMLDFKGLPLLGILKEADSLKEEELEGLEDVFGKRPLVRVQ